MCLCGRRLNPEHPSMTVIHQALTDETETFRFSDLKIQTRRFVSETETFSRHLEFQ